VGQTIAAPNMGDDSTLASTPEFWNQDRRLLFDHHVGFWSHPAVGFEYIAICIDANVTVSRTVWGKDDHSAIVGFWVARCHEASGGKE
jgi:hypothetical protein